MNLLLVSIGTSQTRRIFLLDSRGVIESQVFMTGYAERGRGCSSRKQSLTGIQAAPNLAPGHR